MSINLRIIGKPEPGGSKTGYIIRGTSKVRMVDANKNVAEWKNAVALQARRQYKGPLLSGNICFDIIFAMPRPKNHYGSGRNTEKIKANAPNYSTVKPDRTKLLRSTEDALTGIIWVDDCLICAGHTVKRYVQLDEQPGCYIVISELP
jgi:Holliday junction resolvase RusA-like endonuclease